MAEKPNSKFRSMPSLKEDVGNAGRDMKQVGKSLSSSAKGAAASASEEAGGRAAARLVGRAGYAGAALSAGYDAGRAIDKATGVGKRMVDKVLGPAKYEGDRVELSSDSKARLNDEDYGHEGGRTASASKPSPARRVGTTGEWRDTSGVREGKNEGIGDDVRARAKRYTDDN
jgi:hypothetical protein